MNIGAGKPKIEAALEKYSKEIDEIQIKLLNTWQKDIFGSCLEASGGNVFVAKQMFEAVFTMFASGYIVCYLEEIKHENLDGNVEDDIKDDVVDNLLNDFLDKHNKES